MDTPAKNNGAAETAISTTPVVIGSSKPTIPSRGAEVKPWASRLEHFPQDLKAKNIWCVWRYLARDGKATKVPYMPTGENTVSLAKSNDSSTWSSFEVACSTADLDQEYGVGLFTDGTFTFVDLDHCRNKVTGQTDAWASSVIERLHSYAELSPSHEGVHVFVTPAVSPSIKKNGIEMYSERRFATVTGLRLPDASLYLRAADVKGLRIDVAEGKAGIISAPSPSVEVKTSGFLVAVRNGLTLEQLENGESPNNDRSEGDFQFVAILAEEGLTDAEIDSSFRNSKRMREKWDRNAGNGQTYGERTIATVRKRQAIANGSRIEAPKVSNVDPNDWRSLFHTFDELRNAPPLRFAIEGFLQEDGITFLGGLAGHGKTLIMLSMVKALLSGGCLFEHPAFRVNSPSKRVLYLVPESGRGPFAHRLNLFNLLPFVKQDRLFVQTLSVQERMEGLNDPRMLKAAEGADVFLDTAIRFMSGDENSASDSKAFAQTLFNLQSAGARTIVGAHHSPKAFDKNETISLESALRGSGDVGAMLCAAWAVKQTEFESNRVYIRNIKARDFEACAPFELEGRPYIDETGNFKVVAAPGLARSPKTTKQPEYLPAAKALRAQGLTFEAIATQLPVNEKTLRRWAKEGKL
jgi:hypothetical protein